MRGNTILLKKLIPKKNLEKHVKTLFFPKNLNSEKSLEKHYFPKKINFEKKFRKTRKNTVFQKIF